MPNFDGSVSTGDKRRTFSEKTGLLFSSPGVEICRPSGFIIKCVVVLWERGPDWSRRCSMSVPLYVGQFLEMSRQRTAAWHLGECETMPA